MLKVMVPTTTAQHRQALSRIDQLMEADNRADDAELEALVLLVEEFEREAFPIEEPDPADMIAFRMADLRIDEADVARRTGIRISDVFEMLNGQRPVSLDAIATLAEGLGIPTQLLISLSLRSPGWRARGLEEDERESAHAAEREADSF